MKPKTKCQHNGERPNVLLAIYSQGPFTVATFGCRNCRKVYRRRLLTCDLEAAIQAVKEL